MSGDGTYGLHSARWRDIRKALRKLGGRPTTSTDARGNILILMPTGSLVPCGHPSAGSEQVRHQTLAELVDAVRAARVEPHLFLAALHGEGCTWTQRPAIVGNLERFLRHGGHRLDNEPAWKRALAAFAQQQRERANRPSAATPNPAPDAPNPEPEPQPEAPAPAAGFTLFTNMRAAALTPNAGPDVDRTHPLTLREAVDAAGVPAEARERAFKIAHNGMRSRRDPLATMVADGSIVFTPHPRLRGKTEARFTEAAALAFAERLARELGTAATQPPPAEPPTAPEPEPEPEGEVAPAEIESAAPAPEPAQGAPATPEPEPPTTEPDAHAHATAMHVVDIIVNGRPITPLPPASRLPRNAPTEPVKGVGHALSLLCFTRGLIPVYYEDDGEAVDIVKTLYLLAHDVLAAGGN